MDNQSENLEVFHLIESALDCQREVLVDHLLQRVRDGQKLIAEGKCGAEKAFDMVISQVDRIEAFDVARKEQRKGQSIYSVLAPK